MIRLECPACKRDSYTSYVDSFRQCPYCGIAFSGKYGAEKRNEIRIKKELPFVFINSEPDLNAGTIDFSISGLSIRVSDKTSVPVGDVITLCIRDSYVKAQVMWVSEKPDQSVTTAGLKILNGRLNLFRS